MQDTGTEHRCPHDGVHPPSGRTRALTSFPRTTNLPCTSKARHLFLWARDSQATVCRWDRRPGCRTEFHGGVWGSQTLGSPSSQTQESCWGEDSHPPHPHPVFQGQTLDSVRMRRGTPETPLFGYSGWWVGVGVWVGGGEGMCFPQPSQPQVRARMAVCVQLSLSVWTCVAVGPGSPS